jgi:hypothetical protein
MLAEFASMEPALTKILPHDRRNAHRNDALCSIPHLN